MRNIHNLRIQIPAEINNKSKSRRMEYLETPTTPNSFSSIINVDSPKTATNGFETPDTQENKFLYWIFDHISESPDFLQFPQIEVSYSESYEKPASPSISTKIGTPRCKTKEKKL